MPNHPLALELIREAGVPIAAPSANAFTRLSPTDAVHVRAALEADVDYILDGGPAPVGIESSVLSVAGEPRLLRPGMISRAEIESVIGPVSLAGSIERAHPSPGLHKKHYAPATPLHLVRNASLPQRGRGAYLWHRHPAGAALLVRMPSTPQEYAAALYRTLHDLDRQRLDWIAVEAPPDDAEWAAINDRLMRASS
jgi:L-threonylcarbamoyladenylate synthase